MRNFQPLKCSPRVLPRGNASWAGPGLKEAQIFPLDALMPVWKNRVIMNVGQNQSLLTFGVSVRGGARKTIPCYQFECAWWGTETEEPPAPCTESKAVWVLRPTALTDILDALPARLAQNVPVFSFFPSRKSKAGGFSTRSSKSRRRPVEKESGQVQRI